MPGLTLVLAALIRWCPIWVPLARPQCRVWQTGPWFDNHRRLRELVAELEALSLAIAEADPGWNR